jgi:hypothetical protein
MAFRETLSQAVDVATERQAPATFQYAVVGLQEDDLASHEAAVAVIGSRFLQLAEDANAALWVVSFQHRSEPPSRLRARKGPFSRFPSLQSSIRAAEQVAFPGIGSLLIGAAAVNQDNLADVFSVVCVWRRGCFLIGDARDDRLRLGVLAIARCALAQPMEVGIDFDCVGRAACEQKFVVCETIFSANGDFKRFIFRGEPSTLEGYRAVLERRLDRALPG